MLLHELLSLEGEDVLRSFDKLLTYGSRYTAAVLVHIAVIDAKNLYLAQGYESMRSFVMDRLELTEDAAYKRLQIARVARQFPQLFRAIAQRRLKLSAARLLAPRLNQGNVEDLITAASGLTVQSVELMLAKRFPQAESLRFDDGVSPISNAQQDSGNSTQVVVPQHPDSEPLATWQAEFVKPPATVAKIRTTLRPLSATRYNLQVSLSAGAHGKLRRYQDLVSNAVPNGNLEDVIERALDAGIAEEERKQFGVGARKGKPRGSVNVRSINAQTRKAVYDRDGGQCTFRYADGTRCGKTKLLEFDHIVPVAKGGKTTIDNLRLLCRAHNQHAADQAFGQRFMDEKRASRRRFASK